MGEEEAELESRDFREALLEKLNGQSEDTQRLIKLVDNRFRAHRRRIYALEKVVKTKLESKTGTRAQAIISGVVVSAILALYRLWELIA